MDEWLSKNIEEDVHILQGSDTKSHLPDNW
jgi:hypothetical protein